MLRGIDFDGPGLGRWMGLAVAKDIKARGGCSMVSSTCATALARIERTLRDIKQRCLGFNMQPHSHAEVMPTDEGPSDRRSWRIVGRRRKIRETYKRSCTFRYIGAHQYLGLKTWQIVSSCFDTQTMKYMVALTFPSPSHSSCVLDEWWSSGKLEIHGIYF